MTISDSVPIQFWDIDEETYNEKQICGVYNACFLLPVECDDHIPIQFTDTVYDTYEIRIFDENGDVLYTIDADEVADDYFAASITPSELSPSLCQVVQFKIFGTQTPGDSDFEIDAGDYDTDASPWQVSGSGNGWAWEDDSGDGSAKTNTIGPSSSKYLQQEFILNAGDTVTGLTGELRAQEFTPGGAYLRLYLFDGAVHTQVGEYLISSAGTVTFTFGDFTVPSTQTHIEIRAVNTVSGEYMIWVHEFTFKVSHPFKKSDGIDLKESHDCTELLEYANSTDFDGIKYEISPQPTFYLRIPAQFWKENNPMTQEDSELSNGVIVTRRQTIQRKTLLEIGFVPNYLHLKIQNVLMHETVSINGQTYKRRDEYEAENLNRYPLKKGSVWLTKYNSVEKNTI